MHLELPGIHLNTKACTALGTLLQNTSTKFLNLSGYRNNSIDDPHDEGTIDDEGIDALLPALENSSELETLNLHNNSVTPNAWQKLASILKTNSNWTELTVDLGIGNTPQHYDIVKEPWKHLQMLWYTTTHCGTSIFG